jgi:hypothetical protein
VAKVSHASQLIAWNKPRFIFVRPAQVGTASVPGAIHEACSVNLTYQNQPRTISRKGEEPVRNGDRSQDKEKTKVTRYRSIMLIAALGCAFAAQAQNANQLSTEVKQLYTGIKTNLMKAAEKMPEADYGFKATPDVRPFGQLVAHVADSQMRGCSAVKGEKVSPNAASKTSKADLVAALKESFDYCDGAYDSLTDASATQMVATFRGQRSKLAALYGNVSHDNEMYGTIAVYMRLKGLVPPSSEGR